MRPPKIPLGQAPEHAHTSMVPMRDGTRLATDVYLPPGPGPFPALLTRTPYDKTSETGLLSLVAGFFNERGYAFVAQDVRGKARSEGSTELFVFEAVDGYDTIDWLAGQRWCSGWVAMWGMSYYGFTQWAAAAAGHWALKAISPRNTSSQIGLGWFHRQGVPKLLFPAAWGAHVAIDEHAYSVEDGALDWTVRPLSSVLAPAFGTADATGFRRWQRAKEQDPYWTIGIYGNRTPTTSLTIPAFHNAAWFDLLRHTQIAEWALSSATSPAPQTLLIRATDHARYEWQDSPPGAAAEEMLVANTLQRLESDLRPEADFYDAVRRSPSTSSRRPKIRWQQAHDGWRDAWDWPPRDAVPLSLFLGAGHVLSTSPQRQSRWLEWVHDPDHPVPSTEVDEQYWVGNPADETVLDGRDDVLVFTTEPWDADLDLTGPMMADLRVASSAPSMHVVVKFAEVLPDGRTRRIGDGAALVSAADESRRVNVDLGPTGYTVRAGHRLRAFVACSDFPRFVVHPGHDDDDPWEAVRTQQNTQRLAVGSLDGSRIVVTVSSSLD